MWRFLHGDWGTTREISFSIPRLNISMENQPKIDSAKKNHLHYTQSIVMILIILQKKDFINQSFKNEGN